MRYRKVKRNGRTLYKHRVVMEEKLGRTLATSEIVHHKNHKPLDNRVGNLKVTTTKAHSRHHMLIHPVVKKCIFCRTKFEPPPSHRPRDLTCSRVCRAAAICIGRLGKRAKGICFVDIWQRVHGGTESLRAIGRDYGVAHICVRRVGAWPEALATHVNRYLTRTADPDG